MRRMDELLWFPLRGQPHAADLLTAEVQGWPPPCRHADEAHGDPGVYRKPNTSKPAPGHKIYPYLLRDLPVTRPNQVWAMDLTYVPMARGFVYLAAVIDWFSRRVLSWRLSITMEAGFCVEAVEEALARRQAGDLQHRSGQPVHQHRIHRPADRQRHRHQHGRPGRLADNVFVERLWRSVKYGYLRAYDTVAEARNSLASYFGFYNAVSYYPTRLCH